MNNEKSTILIQPDSTRKNIFYLLLAEGGTKLLSFLSFSVMARGLSQQAYGVVALAFSVGSLFYIFFNLGLDYHVIRDIRNLFKEERRSGLQDLVSAVATIKVWLLPIFSLVFLGIFWLMRWEASYFPVMLSIFIYFYLTSAMMLILFFFRAFEKMVYEFIIRNVQALALLVVSFIFGYVYKDIFPLSLGYVGITGIVLLLLYMFFIRKSGLKIYLSNWMHRREVVLVGETRYLFLTGICTSVFFGTDVLIISFLKGVEDVAIYKNAIMITLALFLIPTAVTQGFFPRLVQHQVELSEFFRAVKKILLRLIPLGLGVSALFIFVGPWFIVTLFGKNYADSAPLFQVSLLAFLFATVNQVLGYGMIAIGKYKEYFIITFIVAIVNVVLNFILISRLGLMGGIISLNASHFLLILLPSAYLYFLSVYNQKKQYNIIT